MKPKSDERNASPLEAEVAELKAYLPMLARMAAFERWSSGKGIPDAIMRLEEWTHVNHEEPFDSGVPEWERPDDEPLPATAQVLQDAYTDRTSPGWREWAAS